MKNMIIANGIVVGTFVTENEKWECMYDYLNAFHLNKAIFEIRTEIAKKFRSYSQENCAMELYRTEINHIFRSWCRGMLSEMELEKCKLEIRRAWFTEFTKKNHVNNIAMLTAEMLAEKATDLKEEK